MEYRHNIKKLVVSLNTAGDLYYNTVLKSSPFFTDHLRSLFPSKHERVSINDSLRYPINVQHLKKLFINAISNDPKDHQLAMQLLEMNHESTKIIVECVHFDIVSSQNAFDVTSILTFRQMRKVKFPENFTIKSWSWQVTRFASSEWSSQQTRW